MKVTIGCDHTGNELKKAIIEFLTCQGKEVFDLSACEGDEFPEIGERVAREVVSGKSDFGVIICGTGIGVSIAANKVPGARAALCTDSFCARMTRLHNDANILALGARVVGLDLAIDIVSNFFATDFSHEERHVRRIGKIAKIDDKFRKE
ncbi:MAG: ribose 5-phosphate isomerase B [Clostridia bacterium]